MAGHRFRRSLDLLVPVPSRCRCRLHAWLAAGAVLIGMWGGVAAALAQAVDPNLYGTNGTVNAQVVVGNTLYIGGAFGLVGKPTGGFATVDDAAGAATAFPQVAGTVNAIVSDDAGGWYIGGNFNSVGGLPRSNLAHVLADNSVSPWSPATNAAVQSLALSGNTVYIGGLFTTAGGQPRLGLAALDANTGAAAPWTPGAGGQFTALAVDGSIVYVGGVFSSLGGQPRSAIGAVDAVTGLATSWNPGANSNVFALVADGGTIYAGGAFTTIGGQPRSKIAALDATTGLATSWNPIAAPAGGGFTVRALAKDGGTVYAGGSFTTMGGQPRNRIAAIDAATGVPTAWNPDASADVRSILIQPGQVYVGGSFTFVGGQQRNRAAALDAATGLATGWNPDVAGTSVFAIRRSGSTVALGGQFNGLAFIPRSSLAAIDLGSGQVNGWNPGGINGSVIAMASDGTSLYVGGTFTIVGSQTRNRLAEVDLATGVPTAWDPNVGGAQISAIAVDGSSVFVGCTFTSIGGQPRNRIAEIDRATGLPTAWNPDANDRVSALAVDGNTVYAGGFFTTIGGQPRNRVAALDRGTGLATPWDPNAVDGTVASLAVRNGVVYVGGAFNNIGGQLRRLVAAIDVTTGLATSWDASVSSGSNVAAIAASSSAVYIGGSLFGIGPDARSGIAALDPATGAALDWCSTGTGGTGNVNSLALSGSSVFAGGGFSSMEAVPVGFVARIEAILPPSHPLTTAVDPPGSGQVTRSPDSASYEGDAEVSLTAISEPGYRFTGWSGDLTGTANPQSLVMAGPRAVTAHFETTPVYELVVQVDPAESEFEPGIPSGEVAGAGTHEEGAVVTLTAFPALDYVFVGWSGDVTGTDNPATITMDGNKTVVAHFEPTQFRILTFVTGSGSIEPRQPIFVPNGGSQTLTFTAGSQFYLEKIRVDGVFFPPTPSYTFENVHAHHTLRAFFATDTFSIVSTATPGGSISPSGTVRAARFSAPTFSTFAIGNNLLVDLQVDGQSVAPQPRPSEGYGNFVYTFPEIHANHSIHASFLPGHTVTIQHTPGGSTAPDVTFLRVAEGETHTISFTPESGYDLVEVMVDGVPRGPVSSYTFSNVSAPHTLVAYFAPECLSFRDDFDSTLGPGWEIRNERPSSWTIAGGSLQVNVARGDLWQQLNTIENLFLQVAPAGDFVLETSLTASLLYDVHQTHLLLYLNDDYYLRFGLARFGGLFVDHVHEVGQVIAQSGGHAYPSGSVRLRITVTGASALMEYSADGAAWTTLGTVPNLGFRPVKVGLSAFNGIDGFYGGSIVNFDYFSVHALGAGPGGGQVAGTVTGTCGGSSAPLQGVIVDLYTTGADDMDVLVASTATNADGDYSFPGVPAGNYAANLVTPLGYQAVTAIHDVVGCGVASGAGDFALTCIPITAQPRGMGYWKHQVNVYLSGKGQAQETLAALVNYIQLIVQHFNENIVNPVIVYVPGATSTNDQLLQLQQLLTINKGGTNLDRAKQQLLSLLLNVVSGKIHQTHVISGDGATVSQAITFCYDLIVDGDFSNDVTAKSIAEYINDGQTVPSGMVPIGTRVITYDQQADPGPAPPVAFGIHAVPNPVRGAFTASLALARPEAAALELIDIAGRKVWEQEVVGSGRPTVRIGDGVHLASGVYRLRLRQGSLTATRTVVVTH